jgi:hypothetical protein
MCVVREAGRATTKREVVANQEWKTVQDEDAQNVQLLDLSNQILELTKAMHQAMAAETLKKTH